MPLVAFDAPPHSSVTRSAVVPLQVTVALTDPAAVENGTDVEVKGVTSRPFANFVADTELADALGLFGRGVVSLGVVVLSVVLAEDGVAAAAGVLVEVVVDGTVVVVDVAVSVVVPPEPLRGSVSWWEVVCELVDVRVVRCEVADGPSACVGEWFVVTRTAIATTTPAAMTVPRT